MWLSYIELSRVRTNGRLKGSTRYNIWRRLSRCRFVFNSCIGTWDAHCLLSWCNRGNIVAVWLWCKCCFSSFPRGLHGNALLHEKKTDAGKCCERSLHRESINFMKGVMDECTHMANFSGKFSISNWFTKVRSFSIFLTVTDEGVARRKVKCSRSGINKCAPNRHSIVRIHTIHSSNVQSNMQYWVCLHLS